MTYPVPSGTCAIAVAPNGGRRSKADHPALPMTAEELAECAVACRDAGAAMIHVHARDDEGRHSLDPDLMKRCLRKVREAVGDDLVIQMTTESLGRYRADEQLNAVRAVMPEAASLALREVIANETDRPAVAQFLTWARNSGIHIQFIAYNMGDLGVLRSLQCENIVASNAASVIFVCGNYNQPQPNIEIRTLLEILLELQMSNNHNWMACAFGRQEAALSAIAASLGGSIRVGFENNTEFADGSRAPDNAALVRQSVGIARSVGVSPMSGQALREKWRHLH